jgi:hypothetical protein
LGIPWTWKGSSVCPGFGEDEVRPEEGFILTMNKETREKLAKISTRVETLRSQLEAIKTEVEAFKDTEQEKFDNMPEGFQEGSQGEVMGAAIEALESACGELDDVDTNLQSVVEYIDTATAE